jgi:hypothetical protein
VRARPDCVKRTAGNAPSRRLRRGDDIPALVEIETGGILLADRLELPCSDDLFSNSEIVFLYARGKFNCAGQRAWLRTRGPEAPRPKVL